MDDSQTEYTGQHGANVEANLMRASSRYVTPIKYLFDRELILASRVHEYDEEGDGWVLDNLINVVGKAASGMVA
jgi:hypothetical protein